MISGAGARPVAFLDADGTLIPFSGLPGAGLSLIRQWLAENRG